ncbi:hypothetical protein PBY51_008269 [Eleginops maclovinus]|uniref:Uncharacterized protein n=1 Tax=Eleginops maclovinus TaxID=56733 RepID=A0AAN7XBR1_ELEMC|nr:hypothetical protein PBY51_008269 [Eleginops maclovinus]
MSGKIITFFFHFVLTLKYVRIKEEEEEEEEEEGGVSLGIVGKKAGEVDGGNADLRSACLPSPPAFLLRASADKPTLDQLTGAPSHNQPGTRRAEETVFVRSQEDTSRADHGAIRRDWKPRNNRGVHY